MIKVTRGGVTKPLVAFVKSASQEGWSRRGANRTTTNPKTMANNRYLDKLKEEDPVGYEKYLEKKRKRERNRYKRMNGKNDTISPE